MGVAPKTREGLLNDVTREMASKSFFRSMPLGFAKRKWQLFSEFALYPYENDVGLKQRSVRFSPRLATNVIWNEPRCMKGIEHLIDHRSALIVFKQ